MSIDPSNLRGGTDPTVDTTTTDPAALANLVTGRSGGTLNSRAHTEGFRPDDTSRMPGIDTHAVKEARQRPAWHRHKTPEPVAAAWDAIEAAVEQLDRLNLEHEELEQQEAESRRAVERAALDAARAGKPAPNTKLVDNTDAKRRLKLQGDAVVKVIRERRAAYNRLVAEHAAQWRADLAAGIDDLRKARRDAWAAYNRASAAYNARVAAVSGLNKLLDPKWLPRQVAADRHTAELRNNAANGHRAISALINSDDFLASDEYVTVPLGIDPPMTLRWWAANASPEHRRWLAHIERDEGFTVSDYTRDDPAPGVPPTPKRAA